MIRKKFNLLITLFFALMFGIFVFNSVAFAKELYVKKGGNDSNDGRTWDTAFATITKAVNSASRRDRIRVAAGTYAENIKIKQELNLYGSYPANGGDVQDYENNTTIIDGQNKDRVIYATAEIALNGFTIKNGKTRNDGGGVCFSGYASISHCNFIGNSARNGAGLAHEDTFYRNGSINYCNFESNNATNNGGAIYLIDTVRESTFSKNAALNNNGGAAFECGTIENCTFRENSAKNQGGATFECSTIEKSTFRKNSAKNQGGAIYNTGEIWHCTFIENSAGNQGGAIYDVTNLINCVFTENKAGTGGGVYVICSSYNSYLINKCTFDGNEATYDAGGLYILGNNSVRVEILNSTFTLNDAERGGGLFLDGAGRWKRIKHCTFIDNIATRGTEIYSNSSSVDTFISCIIWNGDGGCIENKNTALLTFKNCAMDEDECVGENLDDDDIYDSMITLDLSPVYITDYEFSDTHMSEQVSVNGVEHTVFKLNEDDVNLIRGNYALKFEFDDREFYDDQLGASRDRTHPTVGAIEYKRNSNNDDYGSDNSDNSDSSNTPENTTDNTSVVRKGSSSGCNSGILIYGLVLVAGLLMKRK